MKFYFIVSNKIKGPYFYDPNACMACVPRLGLEPRMTVPKTGVLPLHHGSIPLFVKRCKNKQRIGIKQVPFKKCFIFLYFLRGNP